MSAVLTVGCCGRYKALLSGVDLTKWCYFSYSYNLSQSVQQNSTRASVPASTVLASTVLPVCHCNCCGATAIVVVPLQLLWCHCNCCGAFSTRVPSLTAIAIATVTVSAGMHQIQSLNSIIDWCCRGSCEASVGSCGIIIYWLLTYLCRILILLGSCRYPPLQPLHSSPPL